MIHPEVAQHIPDIQKLCREYGVAKLEVFGSAVTDDFDPARSDVDFLVTLPQEFDFGPWGSRLFEFEHDLARILGRGVDVISESSFARKSTQTFANRVNATRTSVFDARNVR